MDRALIDIRYRDIETGIFLSRDPAGFVDGPNVYTYVVQNPWSAFDPDGLARRTDPDGFTWTGRGHQCLMIETPGINCMMNSQNPKMTMTMNNRIPHVINNERQLHKLLDSNPPRLPLDLRHDWMRLRLRIRSLLCEYFPDGDEGGDEDGDGFLLQDDPCGQNYMSVELPANCNLPQELLIRVEEAANQLLPGCHFCISYVHGSVIRTSLLIDSIWYSNNSHAK